MMTTKQLTELPEKPDKSSEYQRGYAAGRRRIEREERQRSFAEAQDEFWLQVFLASIPVMLASSDWRQGNKPLVTVADKIALAEEAANAALRVARPYLS